MRSQILIDQTKQLVTIPSMVGNPEALQAAVKFVADIISAYPNITIERFERNGKPSFLAYYGASRPEKFDILLNAHVDIVPGTPELFTPTEKDGRLYGRGVLDMKGTAIAMTHAFCELAGTVPYSLGLQIVSDEEVGGYDGAQLQIDHGVRASFVIMGEYANHPHTIYNAARGVCWTKIAFRGQEAHGGHPWKGNNAIMKANAFASAVLARFPVPEKETWTTTANIANLTTTNTTPNKVPDYAELMIDFRFTQNEPIFRSKESVQTFITDLDPEAKLLEMPMFEQAIYVQEQNPYVQGLRRAIKQVSGFEPQFLGRPGASDGRHFAPFGSSIVEYGLLGQNSHTAQEYVELDSFEKYYTTLWMFLRKPKLEAPIPRQTSRQRLTAPLAR
jgi:succinyl-diaminopimelate desuccinylase